MKKINSHIIFNLFLFILSLFFLNSLLHKGVILNNVHYVNDLTFLSYNVKESLNHNQLALWTPYFYSGHPLIAIPENYIFDLNFLFITLFRDIYLAMNFSIIIYLFLSGFGMYLLVYHLIRNEKSAFISSIIYMFNGFMYSFVISGHINIIEGYSVLPFIILFVDKALRNKNWIFYSILSGIFFSMQILSGSMIFFLYTALIVFFYIFFYWVFDLLNGNFIRISTKSILIGILIIGLTLGLSAVKLLPVIEFTKISSRAVNVSFNEFLGYPIELKNFISVLIINNSYVGISAAIGILGTILLAFSLLAYKKRIVIFSLFLILFSLLFASGSFLADIMYKVNGFDKLRHVERSLFMFVFAASILVGYGFSLLSEKIEKTEKINRFKNHLFFIIIFLILTELIFLQKFPSSTKVIYPNEIGLLNYISDDKSVFRTINFAQKDIIGAAGYNYYAQKGISEVKGGGGIWVNDYTTFIAVAQESFNTKMFGVLNIKYLVSDKILKDAKSDSDITNDITLVDKFNECKECAIWNAYGPYLYKNNKFFPRFYTVPNSILVVGDSAMVKQVIYILMLNKYFDPKNTVLIEGTKINDYSIDFLKRFNVILLLKDSIDQNSIDRLREYATQGIVVPDILNGKSKVSDDDITFILTSTFNKTRGYSDKTNIEEYSNNLVVLNLDSDNVKNESNKGWLVVSERFAYFPGWKSTINGKPIELFKANNVISSIYLGGENGKLKFEYLPNSYKTGRLISIISILIVISYLIYFTYRKGWQRA